jgi:molybdate transport system ATP-binding protein
MIEIDIGKQLGAFQLDAHLHGEAHGVTALVGRSGAGKTTILQAIAGGLRPDRGRIAIAGRVLFDHAAGIIMPVHQRRIGYVFQDGRLFPHLTVHGNLLYGWSRSGPDRPFAVDAIVALLGLVPLLARRPHDLSGGEKQRVAIGRALLSQPLLMLYDEPLAALDPERKAELLPFLEQVARTFRLPSIYVSHAIDEVARIADRVAVVDHGRVTAYGPIAEMSARFGALARKLPQLTGIIVAHDHAAATSMLDVNGQCLTVPLLAGAPGSVVDVRLEPRAAEETATAQARANDA